MELRVLRTLKQKRLHFEMEVKLECLNLEKDEDFPNKFRPMKQFFQGEMVKLFS